MMYLITMERPDGKHEDVLVTAATLAIADDRARKRGPGRPVSGCEYHVAYYQVCTQSMTYTEHTTAAEAVARVEKFGYGSIIKFNQEMNLPGCLPLWVSRCSAMWSFENGEWWSHYLFDGIGGKLEKERPA
jgi:hypothetical protein